jgi:protein TonB
VPAPVPAARAVIRQGGAYGPPDSGSRSSGDSQRVGTAPNGEPLYAAKWYRKPYDDELRGYLSTATGPGWGLIACRTAPDYRVEDCVGLEEHPRGSLINRAILAAAWQFKVRPPRLGGRSLVGEWVRIRIDYDLGPPPGPR